MSLFSYSSSHLRSSCSFWQSPLFIDDLSLFCNCTGAWCSVLLHCTDRHRWRVQSPYYFPHKDLIMYQNIFHIGPQQLPDNLGSFHGPQHGFQSIEFSFSLPSQSVTYIYAVITTSANKDDCLPAWQEYRSLFIYQ